MPKRALVEKRPFLLLSIAAALAYYFLRDSDLGELYTTPIKGAACALLAVYALMRHAGRDAWLIALVMALAAIADMAIEFYFRTGAAIFIASHLAALALYLQPHNRRDTVTGSQRSAAWALILLTPLTGYLLTLDWTVVLYAVFLGAMAAAAWTSRFSRYHVGIGALLFVVSDLLIFARMSGASVGNLPHLLIWPTYYAGQFLICTGVIQTLRRNHQA